LPNEHGLTAGIFRAKDGLHYDETLFTSPFSVSFRFDCLLLKPRRRFPEGKRGAVQERFDLLDTNKDGVLTMDEVGRPRLFQRLDADGDGVVTSSEAVAFLRPDLGVCSQRTQVLSWGRRCRKMVRHDGGSEYSICQHVRRGSESPQLGYLQAEILFDKRSTNDTSQSL
jgi:hypothetical protein